MKKDKPRLYGIRVPVRLYGDNINVVWGDKKLAAIYTEGKEDKDTSHLLGWCVEHDDESYVYLGESLTDYDTIVHELTHAILDITHRRNISLNDEQGEQEHTAYLFGYIIGFVLSTNLDEWWYTTNPQFKKATWKRDRRKKSNKKTRKSIS